MVNSLLDKISRSAKDGVITKWYNGKIGEIVDLQGNGVYRFIDYEVDSTGNAWIRPVTKEEQLACPIVASGIIAYWLRHRHEMYVSVLFESYSNLCLTTYKQAHGMDVDAWKRDLCREFTFEHHIPAEKKCIEQSKAISAYLTDSDNKTLQEVARNYLEFFREQQRKKLQSCYVKENQFIGPFLDFYLENSAARHCIVWLRTTYDMPLDWLQMQEYLDSKNLAIYRINVGIAKSKDNVIKQEMEGTPAIFLFNKGEYVTFLDSHSSEDLHKNAFKTTDGFDKWFTEYVILK